MPLLWVTGGRADQGRTRHSTVGHRPRVRGEIPPPAIPRGSAPPPGNRRAVSGFTPIRDALVDPLEECTASRGIVGNSWVEAPTPAGTFPRLHALHSCQHREELVVR